MGWKTIPLLGKEDWPQHLASGGVPLGQQLEDPKYAQLSFEERFGMLVDAEHLIRLFLETPCLLEMLLWNKILL